jgi:hypothetical protein
VKKKTPRNWERLRWLHKMIGLYPGKNATDLALLLGMSEGHIKSLLPGMEGAGFLVSEDQYGQLFRCPVAPDAFR